MRNIKFLILVMLCVLPVSCLKWGNRENSRLMEQAQQLVEQMPDSALTLLDAVNTFKFNDAEKAEYTLLWVQARSNAGLDLSTDTEIFGVREYFIRKKDTEKMALACFYAALVSSYESQDSRTIELYKEAFHHAKSANLRLLQGKILYNLGYLNYDIGWYTHAITHYQQAYDIFQTLESQYHLEVYSLNAIANAMMVIVETDSARYYYQTALNLTKKYDDTALQAMIYNNMGVAYGELEQWDSAKYYGRQALRLVTNENEKAYIYLNFADVYYGLNSFDSARYYLNKAEPLLYDIDNLYSLANLQRLYSQIEKNSGDCSKAFEYLELHIKYYTEANEKNDRQLLLEMQGKYDSTAKENEYNRVINRWWKIAGGLLCGLLALTVFSIIVLYKSIERKTALAEAQKKMNEKEFALLQAKQEKAEKILELEKTEQQAYTLQELYNQRDNEMKTEFLERIGLIKKIALLSPYLNENVRKTKADEENFIMKTRDIIRTLNAQKFIDTANELYPGFTDRLKQFCHQLNDREISICCLILFDFSNKELDAFLNNRLKGTLSSIQNWKSAIRKKLNMPPMGDIKEFLMEKIIHEE